MNRLLIRKTFSKLSGPFSVRLLQRLSGEGFILPLYHLVSDNPSPLVRHLYPVATVVQFKKDLDFYLQHFKPASFDEVLRFAKTKTYSGKPVFFLTFDDGLRECYEVVRPVLKEKGLTAAFFVNTAFIGNKSMGHRQKVSFLIEVIINNTDSALNEKAGLAIGVSDAGPHDIIQVLKKCTISDGETIERIAQVYNLDFKKALAEYKPYMDLSQIRKLADEGFIIGSHSNDHPEYHQISEDEMKAQVVKSFKFLDGSAGINERIFSFPFHDIDVPLSFYEYLRDEAGVQASFGTSGIKYDNAPGNLQRVPVELKGFQDAESIIRTEYFYYLVKSFLRKNRITRK